MARVRAFSIGKIPEAKKFGGQAALIIESLRKEQPQTVKSIAADIKGALTTRQDPERVVAFYMSDWKKKGIVTASEVEVADEEGAKESTKPAAQTEGDGEEDVEEDEEEDADEDGQVASGKDLSMADEVELHEELSAAEPSPGGKFDGLRPTEAVKKVLQQGKLNQVATIEAYLTEHGYVCKRGAVQTSLANLVRSGVAKKTGDGTYGLR